MRSQKDTRVRLEYQRDKLKHELEEERDRLRFVARGGRWLSEEVDEEETCLLVFFESSDSSYSLVFLRLPDSPHSTPRIPNLPRKLAAPIFATSEHNNFFP